MTHWGCPSSGTGRGQCLLPGRCHPGLLTACRWKHPSFPTLLTAPFSGFSLPGWDKPWVGKGLRSLLMGEWALLRCLKSLFSGSVRGGGDGRVPVRAWGRDEKGFGLSPQVGAVLLPTPWASRFRGRPSPSRGSHGQTQPRSRNDSKLLVENHSPSVSRR